MMLMLMARSAIAVINLRYRDGSRPLCPVPDRLPARRRRADGAVQLAATPDGTAARSCCASKTPTPSARPGTWLPASSTACGGWDSIGTKAPTSAGRTRRTFNRSVSTGTARCAIASSRRPRLLLLLLDRRCLQAETRRPPRPPAADGCTTGPAGSSRTDDDCAARGRRLAARSPAAWFPRARRRSSIRCTVRSGSTTATSRTSSCCAPMASRPIISRSSPTTSTWRSRTWFAATITSRTRRSTSSCSRRWGGRCPRSRTCR